MSEVEAAMVYIAHAAGEDEDEDYDVPTNLLPLAPRSSAFALASALETLPPPSARAAVAAADTIEPPTVLRPSAPSFSGPAELAVSLAQLPVLGAQPSAPSLSLSALACDAALARLPRLGSRSSGRISVSDRTASLTMHTARTSIADLRATMRGAPSFPRIPRAPETPSTLPVALESGALPPAAVVRTARPSLGARLGALGFGIATGVIIGLVAIVPNPSARALVSSIFERVAHSF